MPKRNKRVEECFISPATLAGVSNDTAVLLALSGGADSRALLHLLAADAKANGYSLILAHVNHGIRGEDALRDRDFCVDLANDYGLEICVLDADVPALAQASGRGLEEEARAVRYDFFASLMHERNIGLLATAHHADDNLETMLFRLARGTGLAGLCGIAPSRAFAGGVLVRPLLSVTRREILDFCAENKLKYVTDSTNTDTHYARNAIRADIAPQLEALFDGVASRAIATAESLREDETLLQALTQTAMNEACTADGFSLASLRRMPKPICKRALARRFEELTAHTLERVHIDALMALIADASTITEIALPDDYVALVEFDCLRFLRRKDTENGETFDLPLEIGKTIITPSGICIKAEQEDVALPKIHNSSTGSYIILHATFDIMEKSLHWRLRREGDLLLQGGMHRKLRRLYREAGIAPRWRDRMPLLCDDEGIVWAPFVGARDGLLKNGTAWRITVELPTVNELQKNGHYQGNGGNT
jgi:tRNA(Ile)-lysidine synthase